MSVIRLMSVMVAALVLAATNCPTTAQTRAKVIAAGKVIAEKHCASCHATGLKGASPHRHAPPFRTLRTRYDLDNLQEAFVEGVAVGHRGVDMPEFQFSPDATDALITFLKSLRH